MRPLLVLDLDDTLYPERAFVLSGFAAVDRWMTEQLGRRGFGERAAALFEAGLRGTIFDAVVEEMGLPEPAGLVPRLVEIYRTHEPDIQLHGDAAWALDALAGVADFGLLSDGYLETQRRKLGALGVEERFLAVVFSDEFGREHWKPSPVPYLAMMERTGRDGADCIYVSDNPLKDFVTANALGWHTIRIRRHDGIYRDVEIPPGYGARTEITTLRALAELGWPAPR